MKRSEIWWVEFPHSVHGEIKKTRPAIIVSNDLLNKHANRVQIVPLTTNTTKVYPSEALIRLNQKSVKAMADQLQTASKKRLIKCVGIVSKKDMHNIDRALKVVLSLQ